MIPTSTAPSPPSVDNIQDRLTELTHQIERVFALLCALTERVEVIETELSGRRGEEDEDLPGRPPGEWATVKEASYLTARSGAWIRKWRNRGEIGQHIEGGRILINLEDARRAVVRHSRTFEILRLSEHDKETPRSARPISRSPHRRRKST